jgi:hypothetical protein
MARKKKKKTKKRRRKTKTARLNLLIRADLKEWAHKYAEARDTSISAIITNHFIDLRNSEVGIDVDQI